MMIRNFLFHRVSAAADPLWPPMQPLLFDKIIRYLTGNFGVVLLEDYLKDPTLFKNEGSLATVSFDDGYKDNLEVAAPILKRYRCPASFYVVTDCIDQNLPTWTYITDHIFQQEKIQGLQLEGDFLPDGFRQLSWSTKMEGIELAKKIKPWMKTLTNPQRVCVLDKLMKVNNGAELPREMMMNWAEVKQLDNAGFYVASHSRSHPMLASLTSVQEIEEELNSSAVRLEEKLGHRPLTISYPIGSWDERVLQAAAGTGYKYGLAVEQRFYKTGTDNILAIPRVELYNEPWWKARMRISGLYQTVKKLVK